MNANINDILNGNGGKLLRNGSAIRLHSTTLSYNGVELTVEYLARGAFLAATATEPAETPMCEIYVVKTISGDDITNIVSESLVGELEELVEEGWK